MPDGAHEMVILSMVDRGEIAHKSRAGNEREFTVEMRPGVVTPGGKRFAFKDQCRNPKERPVGVRALPFGPGGII